MQRAFAIAAHTVAHCASLSPCVLDGGAWRARVGGACGG